MSNISIVGAPFNGGQPKKGVEKAPTTLRNAGLQSILEKGGWKVTHDQDVPVRGAPADSDTHGLTKFPKYVGGFCSDLHKVVGDRARAGDFVFTIGGDHSIAAGTIPGILSARPDTFVVWVDAHADINSPETTDSGNMHGMPVALAAHICEKLPGFEYLDTAPALNLANLAYIGLRDVDSGKKETLKKHNIKAFMMEDVQKLGITAVIDDIIKYSGDKVIHLSFDVDGIDPEFMPATGTPVAKGLTLEDGTYICKTLARTGRVRSFDLAEVNTDLGDETAAKHTVTNSIALVESLLGKQS
jgi:arginase